MSSNSDPTYQGEASAEIPLDMTSSASPGPGVPTGDLADASGKAFDLPDAASERHAGPTGYGREEPTVQDLADNSCATISHQADGEQLQASGRADLFAGIFGAGSSWHIRSIMIADIGIGRRLRPLDDAAVFALMESMATSSLLHAPVVRMSGANGRDIELVSGAQRIEAARRLGWSTIDCRVVEVTDLKARLMEIDENLIRAALSPAEEALLLNCRKHAYEALAGNVKSKGIHAANARMGRAYDASANMAEAFTSDAAKRTGKSARSIQRSIKRVAKLGEEQVTRVIGTSLDCGAELDALAELEPHDRAALISLAEAGGHVSAARERPSSVHFPAGAPLDETSGILAATGNPSGIWGVDEPAALGRDSAGVIALKNAWLAASLDERVFFRKWLAEEAAA